MARQHASGTGLMADDFRFAVFGLARPEDDFALRELLRRSPMGDQIRLIFARDPSIFDAVAVDGVHHDIIVARDGKSGKLLAMGSRTVREIFVNGEPTRLGYLAQLRRDPVCTGRKRMLIEGLAFCAGLRRADEQPYDLTSIVADNRLARSTLAAGLRNVPAYAPLETLVTFSFPLCRVRRCHPRPGLTLTGGTRGDYICIADLLGRYNRRYQFAPRWTADDLASPLRCRGLAPEHFVLARRRGRVVGSLAVWDQRAFKQTLIAGYGPALARWRFAFNMAAPLLRQPRLPPPGSELQLAYASHLAVEDEDPHVFHELLAAAAHQARERGLDYLVLALAARHPLVAVARGFVAHEYESILYAVHPPEAAPSLARLDGRVAHVEVATL